MNQDKKGFIFIETVIVVLVLTFSLVGLYNMFSHVMLNSERRKKYDNMNDIYKVNLIYELIPKEKWPTASYETITQSNCTNFISSDCADLLNDLEIEYIILTGEKIKDISSNTLNPSMIEYFKTIPKNGKSIIIEFNKNNDKYYASLELEV